MFKQFFNYPGSYMCYVFVFVITNYEVFVHYPYLHWIKTEPVLKMIYDTDIDIFNRVPNACGNWDCSAIKTKSDLHNNTILRGRHQLITLVGWLDKVWLAFYHLHDIHTKSDKNQSSSFGDYYMSNKNWWCNLKTLPDKS